LFTGLKPTLWRKTGAGGGKKKGEHGIEEGKGMGGGKNKKLRWVRVEYL